MYTKQEETILRKKFWTSFGQYLAPILSADGNKINWINYKTGIKLIRFKMNVTHREAYIGIEISDDDPELQKLYNDYFIKFRDEINRNETGNWTFEEFKGINSSNMKRIFQILPGVNIYKEDNWPNIISFLKDRIILLDKFWSGHKYILEMIF